MVFSASAGAEDPPPADANQEYGSTTGIGGPSSTPGQLEHDASDKNGAVKFRSVDDALAEYFDWKSRVKKQTGLALGTEYTVLPQGGGKPVGNQKFAASGRWAFYGAWTLVDREGSYPGDIVFRVENRHSLGTTLAPGALNVSMGTINSTAVAYNDRGWLLTNLYWHQQFIDGRIAAVAGQLDPTDYVNTYPFINPWTTFLNGAFGNGATIPIPNQTLGAAAGVLPGKHLYAIAGFADPDGDPADPFDSPFRDAWFVHGEVGWVASMAERHEKNLHVTGWYVGDRPTAGLGSGWGLAFSASWRFDERWTPFLRGSFSTGRTGAAKGNVATGVGVTLRGDDLLGIGIAWTRTAAIGGQNQYTAELFYRLHVLRNLAVTPDVQVVLNPLGRPTGSAAVIAGLRARVNF